MTAMWDMPIVLMYVLYVLYCMHCIVCIVLYVYVCMMYCIVYMYMPIVLMYVLHVYSRGFFEDNDPAGGGNYKV